MAVGRWLLCLLPALLLAGCYWTPPPSASDKPAQKSASASGPLIRYVRADDTLYSLGKKFGVDYRLIAKRNHIPYPYKIYIGQRLYIDRTAPASDDAAGRHLKRMASEKPVVTARVQAKKSAPAVAPAKARAQGVAKGDLLWPVNGKLTSRFGRRGSRLHDGVDIAAKAGTPIHAATSGTVVYSDSRLSGYGKLVIVRHAGNMFTAYAHNERNLVKKGDTVKKGDVIARVGSTGRASGPHVHFEVRQGSTPVDPLAYLPRR